MLYQNILETIGQTPTIRLQHFSARPEVSIFAKLEGQNPGASVKDRIALSMIEDGEKSGELTRDKIILESTSGNTGIGLALVAAVKGYRVVLTMSSAMSEERKIMFKAFGAELVETDPTKGTGGAIEKAREMYAAEPQKYWMSNQHNNPANPQAHYDHTALEILADVPEITHFIAGLGTFGTVAGVSRRFREEGRKIEIIAVEPILGQPIQGLRNMQEPNPPGIYTESAYDTKVLVSRDEALAMTRELARKEGIFAGMSAGAALHVARQKSGELAQGQIVVIIPDRGEKYLSTDLYR